MRARSIRSFSLAMLLPLILSAQDSKELTKSAEEKMKAGDWKGAESLLTQAIEMDGTKANPYLGRGSCRIALSDYDGAKADLTRAIELGGRKAKYLTLRGTARFLSGDPKGAISDLSEGPEETKDPEFQAVRGYAYLAVDAWDNALRDFQDVVRRDPSRAERLGCSIWLARAHAGQREAANRDLLLEPPRGWMGRVASYLMGALTKDALLKEASLEPESSRASAQAAAWYYIGSKKRLDGTEDPESFRKALKANAGSDAFDALARAQLEAWSFRDRRRLLDAQEERFRALQRFHADYRFQTLSEQGEPVKKDDDFTFSLDFDREKESVYISQAKGSAQASEGTRILYEKRVMTTWRAEDEAWRMNYSALFESVDQWDTTAFTELDRLVPPNPAVDTAPSPKVFTLYLSLEGKPSPSENGTFRFAVGRGPHPTSWTQDGISRPDTTVREEGEDVVIELPSKKKRLVLEKASGIPKVLEARDFDGKRRQLIRTSFSTGAPFPVVNVPPKIIPLPVDEIIEKMWQESYFWILSSRFNETVARWSRIKQAGKEGEAKRLFVQWLAQYLDTLYQFNVHRNARQYIQWALDQGYKMADMENGIDEVIKTFKQWAAKGHDKLETFLENELGDLALRAATELIEEPADSRLHPLIRQLRQELFEFKAIEAVRSADDDAKAGRIFREELAAARRL